MCAVPLWRHLPMMGRARTHSPLERFADGCVHVVGVSAAVAGCIVLATLARDNGQKLASIVVYAVGCLAMLAASAAYNLGYHTRYRALFRRFDHAAIFLMIAGTYTPFTTQFFNGAHAWLLTAMVWSLSIGGITLKLLKPLAFERWSVVLYLALGWISLLVIGPLLTSLSWFTLVPLVAGGVLYTSGIPFHLWEALPFQNAIWHAFVVAAAACHYAAVLNGVVLPT